MIRTGDLQVVQAAPATTAPTVVAKSFPAPPSARPRVFRSSADEEMTTLLPRKGMTFSSRPPAAVTPVPMPKLASSRPPRAMLEEPPTRPFVRPSAPPPPSVSPIAGPPRASSRPAAKLAPQAERGTMKPKSADADLKSDPRLDPPATVITARTRIVQARPTMSWAAALVAMGVFVGLVTAVVARGDADTLIDATASFVDPSGTHATAAGVEVSSVQTKAEEHRATFVAQVDTLLPPAPPPNVASLDAVNAMPAPPRPAPVAYAAPHRAVWHPTAHAASHAAPAHAAPQNEDRVASSPAPAPKAAPSKRASEDDVESASAADALAKAQLEASLR
jgi:hypothetical protein